MNRISIILIITLCLVSCRDSDKYKFIYKCLSDPDYLEMHLKNANFKSDYYQIYISDENSKKHEIEYLKELKNKFFQNGFSVYNDHISDVHFFPGDSIVIYHEITIEGDSGNCIKFCWVKDSTKWDFRYFTYKNISPPIPDKNGFIPIK